MLVLTEEWPAHNWLMRRLAARQREGAWFEEHRQTFVPSLDEIRQQLQTGP